MRLIQAGLGGFGRSWAALAREADGIELVAVADAALAAGKHVLLEKPLATTLDDARALVETANRAGRVLMVSQNYRFRRPARAVQQLVAEGAIGDLLAVAVRCRRDTRALWPADDFRYRMEHPFVLDMSIHHLDLLRALTGREATRVVARGWRVPDSPYRHDPALTALFDLEGGATVVYEGTWATHEPETSWNGDWELLGERGRITWSGGRPDATSGEVTLYRWNEPPRTAEQPQLAFVDRVGTLHAFRAAVETGAEPETAARDNIESLALVLACVESIGSGAPVDLAARRA
jgi:predicted dehydrogenase